MRSAIKRCAKIRYCRPYRRRRTPALKLTLRRYVDSKTRLELVCRSHTNCPHKTGRCVNLLIINPKKPNSAQRKAARVRLSNKKLITCFIPGDSKSHNLQRESKVLVRGGRTQDLPGVQYKIMRGKLDCSSVTHRLTSRSKYGTKRWRRSIE